MLDVVPAVALAAPAEDFSYRSERGWTPARVARLSTLWCDGFSAGQIARDLGQATRNAVIGKVFRLGLPKHGADTAGARKGHAKRAYKKGMLFGRGKRGQMSAQDLADRAARQQERLAAQEERLKARLEPDLAIPQTERRTFLDLEPGDCRWPIGDPKSPEFHFCNRLQVGTDSRTRSGHNSYCHFHAIRAYDLSVIRARKLPPKLPQDLSRSGASFSRRTVETA